MRGSLLTLVAALAFVSTVSATVCYIRILNPNTGDNTVPFDHEARLASDLFSTFLDINHNDDARVITYEGTNGQFNQAVIALGTKLWACQNANKKIVLNFHASGSSKRYVRKALFKFWQLNKAAQVAAHGNVAATPAAASVVNVLSCMPENFRSWAIRRDFISEAPVNDRDQYGQWLFGPMGSSANMVLEKTREDAELALQGDPTNVGLQQAAQQAQQAVVGIVLTQILRYPTGLDLGWITNMLVLRNAGVDSARILIHAPFDRDDLDGTQIAHSNAKDACYANYPAAATNTNDALTVTRCVLGVTFAMSSDQNDRALVGTNADYVTPVLALNHRNDVPLNSRPTLHTLAAAFPDLVGHIRVTAQANPNTPLGRKAAVSTILTKAPPNGRANIAAMNVLLDAASKAKHPLRKRLQKPIDP